MALYTAGPRSWPRVRTREVSPWPPAGGHTHVAIFNDLGDGFTTMGPDGHLHEVRGCDVLPARDGHTHELTADRVTLDEHDLPVPTCG